MPETPVIRLPTRELDGLDRVFVQPAEHARRIT
jgi:hypothetical protein